MAICLNYLILCVFSFERIIYNDAQDKYTYTFFPCGPDNLISPRKPDEESCKNVAVSIVFSSCA